MSFLDELERTPWEFDFHAAMRQLEAIYRKLPRFGEAVRPEDEGIRIGQEPTTAFGPAALSGFQKATEGNPAQLTVAFFGLFGPNGPLPLHITEYARERIRYLGDRTFAAFANIFNHRMLVLFYRAWAKAEATTSLDRPESSRFDVYVGSLLGIGLSSLRDRGPVPDRAKLQYAGWYSNPVRSAEGLRAILSDYFEVDTNIEEFQGEWLEVPDGSRLELGGAPEVSALGRTTLLGARAYSAQHKFRVTLGPLTREDFSRFLPGEVSLTRLEDMVRSYVGDELAWELRLRLRADASTQVRLGGAERLSYNARVGSGVALADLVIDPSTHHTRRMVA
ncbi:MAG: type VI secretion system baseplate subunit TssG [Polyangiaceae bacterium]|nr:type VI secretion system baseplate subunit TssG [Polyangiaceae bacterium]